MGSVCGGYVVGKWFVCGRYVIGLWSVKAQSVVYRDNYPSCFVFPLTLTANHVGKIMPVPACRQYSCCVLLTLNLLNARLCQYEMAKMCANFLKVTSAELVGALRSTDKWNHRGAPLPRVVSKPFLNLTGCSAFYMPPNAYWFQGWYCNLQASVNR